MCAVIFYLTQSVSETQDDVDVGNLTWEAEVVARIFHSPSSLESSAPTSRTSQRPSGNPPRNSSLPPHTVPGAVCKFEFRSVKWERERGPRRTSISGAGNTRVF